MKEVVLTACIILSIKTFGQGHLFYDSLDFFIRTHTKQIDVDQKINGTTFRHTTCHFNKKLSAITWCGAVTGLDPQCTDTVYFKSEHRDIILPDGTVKIFYFDKLKRLAKATETRTKKGKLPELRVTNYYYADNVSKRVKQMTDENPSYKLVADYFYEGPKLIKVQEVFTGLNGSKYENVQTYSFEYYPDLRVKRETRTSSKESTMVSEYFYTDDK